MTDYRPRGGRGGGGGGGYTRPQRGAYANPSTHPHLAAPRPPGQNDAGSGTSASALLYGRAMNVGPAAQSFNAHQRPVSQIPTTTAHLAVRDPNRPRDPFGPPIQDPFRREGNEIALKSQTDRELNQAMILTPGSYQGRLSRNNNCVIPVIPRLPPPPVPVTEG